MVFTPHRSRLFALLLILACALMASCQGARQLEAAGDHRPTQEQADDHAMTAPSSLELDPNAPPPPFFDPIPPPLSDKKVHELEIVVEEKPMTIAKGVVQHVWTFNGSVPAPTLRVRVGDTLKIKFKNLAGNKVQHSLDFHASEVAWSDEMRTINPGEEIMTEWTANYAGVYMYHCVTAPPVHHVGSGMYGMIIVEPKEGLPPVDREFVLIQNEWYVGEQGGLIDMAESMKQMPSPEYQAFNGVPFQYAERPLKAKAGERLRFFLLNVGPNLDSSFHIVGMIFDTVIKEGAGLTRDTPGGYGAQAVDLSPAQGAIVETVAPEDGLYPFVNHAFNFHDRGATGMLQIGEP